MCVKKESLSKTSKSHSYTKWIRMFVMIIHESKRKDFEDLQIAFLFCWLLESLVGYMKLTKEVFKDLQIWQFLCAMLFVGEYICVLKSRAFQRPPNHILILNESKCLWWSFMSPKGKTLKVFILHFFLLVMESFVFTWRLKERFWKTFKIGIPFVLCYLWVSILRVLKRKAFKDLQITFLY